MGQEDERAQRLDRFAGFQVNAALMATAPAHARVMHCLPAHRGEEATDEILDGPQSIIFQQAGNRLHAQKSMLVWLLEEKPTSGHEKSPSRNGQAAPSKTKSARRTRSR
jgi:ornithine carbamoyltransferase